MTGTDRRVRVGAIDTLNAGGTVWILCGPFPGARHDAIPTILADLAASPGWARVGLQPVARSRRWVHHLGPDSFAELLPNSDDAEGIAVLGERLSSPPRTAIGARIDDGMLLVAIDHGIGDAHLQMGIVAALAGAHVGRRLPSDRNPLARAFVHQLRTRPMRTLVDLCGVAVQAGIPPSMSHQPNALCPQRIGVVGASSAAGAMRNVRRRRERLAAGTSISALLCHSIWDAAHRVGIDLDPTLLTLVDLRRYLPSGAHTDANLATVTTIDLPDAPIDAVRFGELVARAVHSPRPLNRAVGAALVRNVGVGSRLGSGPAPAGRHRLLISDMTRLCTTTPFPWEPDNARFHIALPPGHPRDISVALTATGGRVHATATFCTELLDDATVQHMLDRAMAQLTEQGATR